VNCKIKKLKFILFGLEKIPHLILALLVVKCIIKILFMVEVETEENDTSAPGGKGRY